MKENVKLISYLNLRQAIGWLGISLPLLCILESYVKCNCSLRSSISDYYYSTIGDVFVAILIAVGVFMISYKGYEESLDNLLTNLIGLCGMGVAFFPTNGTEILATYNNCFNVNGYYFYHYAHIAFAFLFFIFQAILLFFYFTKSQKGKKMTSEKKKRNLIYRICALVIIACLGWCVINIEVLDYGIFLPETIALVAFGIAWIVKAELILKDK